MNPNEPVISTAAEWFDRLRHEELGAEELSAWQRWIAASPQHRQAFDRLQDLWQQFDAVPLPALPTAQQRREDTYTGEISVAQWLQRRRRSWNAPRLWKPLAPAAAVALIMLGGFGAWMLWQPSTSPTVTLFETRLAEHRSVRLSDGSALSVGAKSLVWVNFREERREVVLDRGEAFFEVAHDRKRPFVVRAGETSITAIGTAFNVRKADKRVLVVVTEGLVKVESAPGTHPATPVPAGHQLAIDASRTTPTVRSATPALATAWRTGRLEYLNEPLKYVVADVNRYSAHEITIADPALGELRMTGTVFENDIEGWLQGIEAFIPVRVERDAEQRIVLRNKE